MYVSTASWTNTEVLSFSLIFYLGLSGHPLLEVAVFQVAKALTLETDSRFYRIEQPLLDLAQIFCLPVVGQIVVLAPDRSAQSPDTYTFKKGVV